MASEKTQKRLAKAVAEGYAEQAKQVAKAVKENAAAGRRTFALAAPPPEPPQFVSMPAPQTSIIAPGITAALLQGVNELHRIADVLEWYFKTPQAKPLPQAFGAPVITGLVGQTRDATPAPVEAKRAKEGAAGRSEPAEPSATLEDVNRAVLAHIAAKGIKSAAAVLAQFKVKRASELPADSYVAAEAALKV